MTPTRTAITNTAYAIAITLIAFAMLAMLDWRLGQIYAITAV